MKKQTSEIEEILLKRILYIGNKIPECFTTDKRHKQLYLGYPDKLVKELKSFLQDEKKKWVSDLRKWTKGKQVTKDKLREYLNKEEEV